MTEARARRGRDRRGRGLRGRLLAPSGQVGSRIVPVPMWQSRSQHFDEVVRDVIALIAARWPDELAGVTFACEDVPPETRAAQSELIADETAGGPVPLGCLLRGQNPRILVYRRPLEARAPDAAGLAHLVRQVLLDGVAILHSLDRDALD